jgi:DNA-binding NarL/FixJ family response regulator
MTGSVVPSDQAELVATSPCGSATTVLTITPCKLTAQALEQFLTAWGFALLGNHASIDSIVAACPQVRERAVILVDFINHEGQDETRLHDLRRLGSDVRILVIAKSLTDEAKLKILRCGGHGYIETSRDLTYLKKAIEELANGGQWFERRVLFEALGAQASEDVRSKQSLISQKESHEKLTDRERTVAELVRSGLRNKEIANKLNISEKTVKLHLNNVFHKLNVSSRVQLCIGMPPPPPPQTPSLGQ